MPPDFGYRPLALILVLGLSRSLCGQALPAPEPGVERETLIKSALESYDRARARDDRSEARVHLLRVLEEAPDSESALRGLLEVSTDDRDFVTLVAHLYARTAIDDRGRIKIDGKHRKLFPKDDGWPIRLAEGRAAALREWESFLEREKKRLAKTGAAGLALRNAAPLIRDLLRESPAYQAARSHDLEELLVPSPTDDRALLAEIESLMGQALAAGRYGIALRAALCLQGLHRQAGQSDLEGPPAPKLDAGQAQSAASAIARARAALAAEPLTVETMEAMTPEEREAFTAAHVDPTNPGVAVSPNGLYRVETICGFETLLGVASTVEFHHRRLAGWYGVDPFEGTPGLVRVVPEAHGLEAEGSPYWWAGGFQGGNVTTLKFAVGNIEGLGHTLTHELTHRFDGVLFPFQPSWVVEGKASWTGGAYAATTDESFVDNHASYGTIETALIKGYGRVDNLEKLIEGTIEDYRDNYTAGYALYVFLRTWEVEGNAIYAERLLDYLKGAMKGRRAPKKWFVDRFCDGKDGRPEGFEAFATDFAAFLKGFHWLSRADWIARYVGRPGKRPRSEWVYDRPTWTFARHRAEPFFGQDQLRVAGLLMNEVGETEGAIRLLFRSLELDEWDRGVVATLTGLLRQKNRLDEAWWLLAEDARRDADWADPLEPAPFVKSLSKTKKLLEDLAAAAADYRKGGLRVLESRMVSEQRRLARVLGLPLMRYEADALTADASGPLFDPPKRRLDFFGWAEDRLTDHDEHRVADLWFVEEAGGDLHVGRNKPREGTGQLDARAHKRHSYVRTKDWQDAGRYRIEGRVAFTTSYVSGTIVLGHARRDRNVRFSFNAGDYMYAIGQKEEKPKFESLSWSLGGLRDRDGGLPGANPGGRFEFKGAQPSFKFILEVDGARAHAFIENRWVGTYHTVDGQPIEGYVGFGSTFGAFKLQGATVTRLDRAAEAGVRGLGPEGLDLTRDGQDLEATLRNRDVRGMPRVGGGLVVAWIPRTLTKDDELDVDDIIGSARFALRGIRDGLEDHRLPQELALALPADLPEEDRLALAEEFGSEGHPLRVLVHHRKHYIFDLKRPNMPHEPMPVLMYVDPHAVLRICEIYAVGRRGIPERLAHWGRVFRPL